MKKLFYTLIFSALCLVSCNDDSGLFNLMLDTDQRIARLEELCSELNTNITSLQVIVEAQQSGDYITNITPITKDGQQIGYTITFAKHPAITIYNGENGKDGVNGTNGTNGQDGQTPVLGAAKDTDGIYYWTLNGSWLLDGDGHKIRVTGEKGDKGDKGDTGATGATGQNGTNGTNGTDGVTPQLKIQDDYWYISYDNGSTWTQLGKAKGDKGDTGATGAAGSNGTNGQDGDSMFQSVTYDENKVYFMLADGTIITISRGNSTEGNIGNVTIVDGAIQAEFSVSATTKVYFSQGNLQYNSQGTHLCADGTIKSGVWKFATEQWAYVGENNTQRTSTYSGDIDLFMFGTSGYVAGYEPYGCTWVYSEVNSQNYDWGQYNAILNGGNQPGIWRTLTSDEWEYLLNRTNVATSYMYATIMTSEGRRIRGLLLCPDNWVCPDNIKWIIGGSANDNLFSVKEWESLEKSGIILLPFTGYLLPSYDNSYYPCSYNSINVIFYGNRYWSISVKKGSNGFDMSAKYLGITATSFQIDNETLRGRSARTFYEYSGASVRLVKNVE